MVFPPVVITSVSGLVVMGLPATAVPLTVAAEEAVPVPVAVPPPVAVLENCARAPGEHEYSVLSTDDKSTYWSSRSCRTK